MIFYKIGGNVLIKVENVTKNYGENVAVNNISFEIQDGEIVGFLGPNGARKNNNYEYDNRSNRINKRRYRSKWI